MICVDRLWIGLRTGLQGPSQGSSTPLWKVLSETPRFTAPETARLVGVKFEEQQGRRV